MEKFGIIDSRGNQYSMSERMHLIRCLRKWSANLYIFGQLCWGDSITPISIDKENIFTKISNQCQSLGIELWAWMKPGDYRYACHKSDRKIFVDNALRYIELGASGFYLKMDDLHPPEPGQPPNPVREKDAEYHAQLIQELSEALGDKLKAICGEHYHGIIPGDYMYYWGPILNTLPKHVLLTWTGPRIWSKTISPQDIPDTGRPLLLFDNYFASDSDDPGRAPIYPYNGRDPNLINHIEVAVINPNNHYPWQFCAMQTAMDFWRNPNKYDPDKSFTKAIRDLGDMYMEDYVHLT